VRAPPHFLLTTLSTAFAPFLRYISRAPEYAEPRSEI